MTSLAPSIEERLTRHEDVLRSYKDKFEEHKKWLQGQRDMPSFVAKDTSNAWDDMSGTEETETVITTLRSAPVHETLIEKGKLYEQKKEAAREEAIRREMGQLREKPRISKHGASKSYEKPIEERFMELEAKRQKDLKDAIEGRKEDAPQYSFRPTITRKGKQASVRTNSGTQNDAWKQRRDQKLAEARSRLVVESLSEMQEAPIINEHSQRLVDKKKRDESTQGRGPHYTHADSLLERDRLAKLHLWERYQQELVEQQPGNPKITPFAAGLVRDGDTHIRLYDQSFDREERKNYLLQKKLDAEGSECYHTPRITMNAANMRREMPVEDDLLERHEMSKSKKEEGMKQVLVRERHLHQPAINPVSDEIASRLSQTARERLYSPRADYSALQQFPSQMSQHSSMSSFESKPRQRRSGSLDFHARGERGRELSTKRLDALRGQQESQIMQDCTFKPKICRAPLEMKSMDFLDRTTQRMKKKDDKLKQARDERDKKEEMECPFTPNVGYLGRPMDRDDNNIYGGDGKAWGYQDFVERHRAARKQQAEKETGGWVTGKNWTNEVTTPRGFSLGKRDKPVPNVKSLSKPLSPPRAVEGEYYEEGDYGDEMQDPRDLPQQGLFSEGAQTILDYTPHTGREASGSQQQYQPQQSAIPAAWEASRNPAPGPAPVSAWEAPYPSWNPSSQR